MNALILLVIIQLIQLHQFSNAYFHVRTRATSTKNRLLMTKNLGVDEKILIDLFDETRHSVVCVSAFSTSLDILRMNFELPAQTGTGFVWDSKHIVTNYHVISSTSPTSDIQVTFLTKDGYSRNSHKATVRGFDADKDIAVLQLSADTIETACPLRLGNSSLTRVGQSAFAIGNPFGLDQTLTKGIISGLGRRVSSGYNRKPLFNLLQTDAAINPGNSGGPLLDSSGNVIGMNTAIISTSGASAGIGFAIPVDTLKVVVNILIRDGKIAKPYTGIEYIGSAQAKVLGVTSGLVVLSVDKNSPADFAGVRGITQRNIFTLPSVGDVIVKVNGIPVNSESDFLQAIDLNSAGDIVELMIRRASQARRADDATFVEPTQAPIATKFADLVLKLKL